MEVIIEEQTKSNVVDYVTEEDVKQIVSNYGCYSKQEVLKIESYNVHIASNKMLGFLSDYWKLKVAVKTNNGERKWLSFFIKAVSRSNEAKANMVKEMRLYEKELFFYTEIKNGMDVPGIKPWGAKLLTALDDAIVFQDLNALQYDLKNKFDRFDTEHMLEALNTLARFHASSIIFEENMSTELQRNFRISDEYEQYLDEGGYRITDPWFIQCMNGALEIVKSFSKYNKNLRLMNIVENRWYNIWTSALSLSACSSKYRNVVCHRDLWNNNILFHYDKATSQPDDCVIVDFQAVRCQPPAGDVMVLLYCNLEPTFREENLETFLNYYHQKLNFILSSFGILTDKIPTKESFLASAKEQRLWGLIVCACLIPQFWVNDDLTKDIFSDTAQFNEILSRDKATFMKKMIISNNSYKKNVMEIFDEIIERYCIPEDFNCDVPKL